MTRAARKPKGLAFDDLDEDAQQRAIDDARNWNVEHDWWDSVYEDAVRMASIMGIEIEVKTTHGAKTSHHQHAIYFTGFYSQGDGASFSGRYRCKGDAVEKIKEEAPQDEELHRIAAELNVLQVSVKLQTGSTLQCNISMGNGNYCHAGSMSVASVEFADGENHWELDSDFEAETDKMQDLFRSFADWIYYQLKQEYEYLTSDEAVKEQLQDLTFDEDGKIV